MNRGAGFFLTPVFFVSFFPDRGEKFPDGGEKEARAGGQAACGGAAVAAAQPPRDSAGSTGTRGKPAAKPEGEEAGRKIPAF